MEQGLSALQIGFIVIVVTFVVALSAWAYWRDDKKLPQQIDVRCPHCEERQNIRWIKGTTLLSCHRCDNRWSIR